MRDGTFLELKYFDNGSGFNPESVMLSGMGLSNITSRIDSLSGELSINSAEGEGMSVVARINTAKTEPVSPKKRRRRWSEK